MLLLLALEATVSGCGDSSGQQSAAENIGRSDAQFQLSQPAWQGQNMRADRSDGAIPARLITIAAGAAAGEGQVPEACGADSRRDGDGRSA